MKKESVMVMGQLLCPTVILMKVITHMARDMEQEPTDLKAMLNISANMLMGKSMVKVIKICVVVPWIGIYYISSKATPVFCTSAIILHPLPSNLHI